MTEQELETYINELQARRRALVLQLTEVDAQSATLSAGGGSKSYTNRAVADIKAKIAFIDGEIQNAQAALGRTVATGEIQSNYAEFQT